MKISLVLLTYNEIVGLRALFDSIPQESVDEVFAVDGGSTDGTLDFFKEKGVKVVVQERRGRGDAFRTAFAHAKGDALIFFSPDGNEDPKDIPKFRPFLESGYEMVIANRMSNGGHNEEDENLLKHRKWVNQLFTLIANILWGRRQWLADSINGFRAIHKSAWPKLNLDADGYTIEYQSSIRALKSGLGVYEFPTYESKRIDDRVGSPSLKTGIAFLKLLGREMLKS